MAEVTPIMPAPIVLPVSGSRRQNQRKQKPRPERMETEKPEADEKSIPHIDELV